MGVPLLIVETCRRTTHHAHAIRSVRAYARPPESGACPRLRRTRRDRTIGEKAFLRRRAPSRCPSWARPVRPDGGAFGSSDPRLPRPACPCNRRPAAVAPTARVSPACVARMFPSDQASWNGIFCISSCTLRWAPGLKPGAVRALAHRRRSLASGSTAHHDCRAVESPHVQGIHADTHAANVSKNRTSPLFDTFQSSQMSPNSTMRSACSRLATRVISGNRSAFACRSPTNNVRIKLSPLGWAGCPCPVWSMRFDPC